MREGLQWKAHSHEVRVARTWNGKPDPPSGGARPTNASCLAYYFLPNELLFAIACGKIADGIYAQPSVRFNEEQAPASLKMAMCLYPIFYVIRNICSGSTRRK